MAPRAAVVYRSHTGTTKRYAEEIAAHLRTLGLEASASSIADCDPAGLSEMDYVLLGCWTNGWFVVHQHPDVPWTSWARDLPPLDRARVALFTTYTLVTGSMFARMRDHLGRAGGRATLELKSRDGHLSDADRKALQRFIAGAT